MAGSGYLSAPAVTISGDGSGAAAVAAVTTAGRVSAITVTSRGAGYTSARVSVAGDSGALALLDLLALLVQKKK